MLVDSQVRIKEASWLWLLSHQAIILNFVDNRSIGDYLRVAFPAAFGTCIVIPMLVATAFMKSKDSSEGETETNIWN